jgi:hypothetical protein
MRLFGGVKPSNTIYKGCRWNAFGMIWMSRPDPSPESITESVRRLFETRKETLYVFDDFECLNTCKAVRKKLAVVTPDALT